MVNEKAVKAVKWQTLASDDLDSQTRMSVPLQRMKPDEPGYHRLIKVRVFDRVRVRVTFEHLQCTNDADVTRYTWTLRRTNSCRLLTQRHISCVYFPYQFDVNVAMQLNVVTLVVTRTYF